MSSSNPTKSLPPGFRFHPTDEELILHYLRNRASCNPCPVSIIAEVDIYKFDPWDLPARAMFGDREWYFFSPRDRKYPNGLRPNRAAASGYWKATGTDKPITTAGAGGKECIGVKKALVFYKGRPPKGIKTNWIMHEYRLTDAGNTNTYKPLKLRDHSMRLDDWVLCRIYKKSNNLSSISSSSSSSSSFFAPLVMTGQQLEHVETEDQERGNELELDSYNLPALESIPQEEKSTDSPKIPKSSSFSEYLGDYAALSHLFDTQPELPEFNNPITTSNLLFTNGIINNGNCFEVEESPGGASTAQRHCYSSSTSPLKLQMSAAEEANSSKTQNNGSCLVTAGFSNQHSDAAPQYNNLFNQHLLLNSHLFGLH